MKYLFIAIVSLTTLGACTRGIDLRYVDLGSTFHDNNSKVWMVNKLIIKGINTTPSNDYEKDLMIFYENGIINVSPMKKLGHESPRRGKYTIDSQDRTMSVEFSDKENWIIDIDYVTQDSIYLIRTNDQDSPIGIQIKPLPNL